MLLCSRIIFLWMVIAASIHAQDTRELPPPDKEPALPDPKLMLEAWTATISPGPEHKLLDALVGDWITTSKVFFAGPKGEGIECKGIAKSRWVLGNRFIRQEYKSEFPMPSPDGTLKKIPLEGTGLTGFDKFRRLYIGSWCDTTTTAMITMKGTMMQDKAVLRLYGEMDEPMLGIVGRTVKYETKIVSNDEHVLTIYDLGAGDDYKVIEITYHRKK